MIDRRTWLQAVAATVGSLGFSLGCSSEPGQEIYAAVFEVSHIGCIVHVFSPELCEVSVEIQNQSTGEILSNVVLTLPRVARVASAEIGELEADESYRVQIFAGTNEMALWSLVFKTAAEPAASVPVSFLYSADIDVSPEWLSPIFSAMNEHDADFFLCLGDWPYADNPPGAWTLHEYRERHVQARIDERVQSLLQALPAYAIYDDHELRNNWDARFREEEEQRIIDGLQAWDEWFPLRDSEVRYRSVRRGQHCEIFILDTRAFRSRNDAPDDEKKTMLGEVQLEWLRQGLLESTASFKLIATSVPLDFARTEDHWAQFQTERDALIDFITANRISSVLFLTADQHFFAAHHLRSGLKEFQTGPLARGLFEEIPAMQEEELNRFNVLNYAEVLIDTTPALTLIARDENGDELYRERIESGVGALQIVGESGRTFETLGAHHFTGTAPASFDYAQAGSYRLRWIDTDETSDAAILDADGLLILGS